eukprot:TRINITY_DN1699_c0_g2_i6.p1 TRINITY_DN1699_c0_g2~~TRINITY_DN1699_c0_g2_i6.p1  ORF type:complete len:442 (-),score=126.09 TRINITY_DN1699_c0_g2_i6:343-1668(-)
MKVVSIVLLLLIGNCFANYVGELPAVSHYCYPQNEIPVGVVKNAKLISVTTLTRHGDRTRCSGGRTCWKGDTDSYTCQLKGLYGTNNSTRALDSVDRVYREEFMKGKNILAGNCMMGQLTEMGYQQQQVNGANMRKAFVGAHSLLPKDYTINTKKNFFLRSDNEKRTSRSGQSLVTKMYPPQKQAYFTSVVDWNVVDEAVDNVFPNHNIVPHLYDCMTEASKTHDYQKHLNETTIPLAKRVASTLGFKSYKDVNLGRMMDCIMTKSCHFMEVPMTDYMVNEILLDNLWRYNYVNQYKQCTFSKGKSVAEMGMASLMKEIAENVQKTIDAGNSEDAVRLSVYAGHDTGPIMPTVIALTDSPLDYWSPYAATIHFQVYRFNSGEINVLITYNGRNIRPALCKNMMCSWDDFKKALLSLSSTEEAEFLIEDGFDHMHWMGDRQH